MYLLAPETDAKCEDMLDELATIMPSHKGTTILKGWNHSSFVKPNGKTADIFFDAFIAALEATAPIKNFEIVEEL